MESYFWLKAHQYVYCLQRLTRPPQVWKKVEKKSCISWTNILSNPMKLWGLAFLVVHHYHHQPHHHDHHHRRQLSHLPWPLLQAVRSQTRCWALPRCPPGWPRATMSIVLHCSALERESEKVKQPMFMKQIWEQNFWESNRMVDLIHVSWPDNWGKVKWNVNIVLGPTK